MVVDAFTKYALYLPYWKDIDADQLSELMIKQVIPIISILKNLVSNQGLLFTSYFWSTLCHYLQIRHWLSTAFHLQTDSTME